MANVKSPATAVKKPVMTVAELQALDWAALIAKLGPVALMLLTQLIAMFKEPKPLMASAKPAHCPCDVHCCCHEALDHTLAAALILAECCCCDPEPEPVPEPPAPVDE